MGKVIRRCGSFLMMLLLVIGILPMTVNAETTQNTEERNALYVQVPQDWENPCVWAWDSDGNNAFTAWPGEEMEADTVVSLDYDKEKLYYNMVAAKADWLYGLEQWDALLTPERRKELYKEQRSSTTVVKPPKIGRNDPCPCGSGKKYKKCCGRN